MGSEEVCVAGKRRPIEKWLQRKDWDVYDRYWPKRSGMKLSVKVPKIVRTSDKATDSEIYFEKN